MNNKLCSTYYIILNSTIKIDTKCCFIFIDFLFVLINLKVNFNVCNDLLLFLCNFYILSDKFFKGFYGRHRLE